MSVLVIERRDRGVASVTRRGCEAAGLLGMTLKQAGAVGIGGTLEMALEPGAIVQVCGASGSGKSTLLADAARSARMQGWRVVDATDLGIDATRACIDVLQGDVTTAMRTLARAGLAEGGVCLRRVDALSAGQRARFELAAAMERVEELERRGARTLLVVDAFAESLDRVTARGVATLLARAASQWRGTSVCVASVRDDLEGFLRPRRVIELDATGAARSRAPKLVCDGVVAGVSIEHGTMADYLPLSVFHYRAGAPATGVRVLRAVAEAEVVGVLVVSMPSLNASWRREAWGERFACGDRTRDARAINRELRCISRVVVDPRWRGMGVARELVSAYLAEALTPCTESVAAMGRVTGFFGAAGMTRIDVAVSERDARLARVLERAGIGVWRLLLARSAAALIADEPEVERELRRWARASRATARHAGADVEHLVELAWRSVSARRVAFVHGELALPRCVAGRAA